MINAPGIRVEFRTYGSGEQKLRYVYRVTGEDFAISYCRPQGTLPGGRWNDVAAVSGVMTPRQRIEVYEDESGPSYWLYVGDDWAAHRGRFMHWPGVNMKLNGEPRIYVRYRAGCRCGGSRYEHSHTGRRSPLLVADNDLGREYDPESGEPTEFKTADVLETFRTYLQDVVLAAIEAHPVASERVDLWPEPAPVAVPTWAASLFCFGGRRDVDRIECGQVNSQGLPAAERYGMDGNGRRLASLDVKNDGTVPEVAYEGFLWCGLPWGDGGLDPLPPIPGHNAGWDDQRVIRIRPKMANEIYIADHGAYERRRAELAAASPERKHFTDAEINDFMCARVRTIVPIHAYQGGYEQPVVLIRRELGFDEVEVPTTQLAPNQGSRVRKVISPL